MDEKEKEDRRTRWLQNEALRRFWRNAKRRLCPDCAEPVLRGYDADYGAFLVAADPDPLPAEMELEALLRGLGTFDYDGEKLIRRGFNDLLRRRTAVLVQHHCHLSGCRYWERGRGTDGRPSGSQRTAEAKPAPPGQASDDGAIPF